MRRNQKKEKTNFLSVGFILMMGLMLVCLSFSACGGGEKKEAAPTTASDVSPGSKQAVKPTAAPTGTPAAEAGWKTHRLKNCSISLPGDWGGNVESQVWWPGKADLNRGIPALHVHCGGMPLTPSQSFDDRLKSYLGTEPILKEKVNISGLSGLKCVWEKLGNKHMGIFLEEKIGGGVAVIHFVKCQAPTDVYDEHAADFEKIINSFRFFK
jgi:hypothetical protein